MMSMNVIIKFGKFKKSSSADKKNETEVWLVITIKWTFVKCVQHISYSSKVQ